MPEGKYQLSPRDESVRTTKIWYDTLRSNWLILLLAFVLGGGIGLLNAIYSKPTFTGKLTFVLSTDSKAGGLSGLASQFGIDLTSTGNDLFTGDNILSLFKSEKMIKEVLFKKPPTTKDILANIIAKEWEWDKKWIKKERTEKQFPFPHNINTLTPVQDSLLREIYSKILAESLVVSRNDRRLNVYEIATYSSNEDFACYLTRFLMDQTAKFYIETKTSLAKQNLLMIQQEADSLRQLLGMTIVSTAAETDRTFNLNPALQQQRSSVQKGQFRTTVLGTAYGEVIKNLEIAKITLQREKPLYQIIDMPNEPLKKNKLSKQKGLIYGGLIGTILMSLVLLYRGMIWNKNYLTK